MSSPANILRKFLVEQGKADSPGVRERMSATLPQAMYQSMPDDVDHVISFYNMRGRSFGSSQTDGQYHRHPGVDILYRHPSVEEGDASIDAICRFLDSRKAAAGFSATIGDMIYYFQSVYRAADLVSLGEEEGTRRWLWSVRYNMVPGKAPTTVG